MDTKEKCGLFGAVLKPSKEAVGNISKMVYAGLFQLQHRGREGAGISAYSNGRIKTLKGAGTIEWVFREQVPRADLAQFILDHTIKEGILEYIIRHNEHLSEEERCELSLHNTKKQLLDCALDIFEERNKQNPLNTLNGSAAIGHVRYSTTGASGGKNVQPIVFGFQGKDVAIAHNGNVKTENLEKIIKKRGDYARLDTTDTGLIAALIATSKAPSFVGAVLETLSFLEGAFSLLILYEGKIFAIKDKYSIRPLCLGQTDTHYLVASETVALDNLRAQFLGEIKPGAMIVLDPKKQSITKIIWAHLPQTRCCVFESIYFSRPESLGPGGIRISLYRKAMGREAAREHPILDADVVSPVLDSGLFAGFGYAIELEKIFRERKTPVPEGGLFDYAFLRGRVDRTFMHPIADERKLLQNLKHSAIPEVIRGKHIVVIDDSIVRGNVMPYIIEILRFFGASRVSVIIPSPPLRHPCHLGVDLPLRADYIAHDKSVEEIRETIGADYLGYLSLEGLYRALGQSRENYCDGCFTNEYPVPFPDEAAYQPKSEIKK